MAEYAHRNTTELAIGDVVFNAGMEIEIVGGGEYPNWPGTFGWHGRIRNVEEVNAQGFVPKSWRVKTLPNGYTDETVEAGTYWLIQGNELAYWTTLEGIRNDV